MGCPYIFINNLTKIASTFKLIKNLVSEKCKRQIYYAYAFSKINYGIEVYGHTSKSNINKIQSMQNKILKILYNKDCYTSTKQLHKELNLLMVQDIFNTSILNLVYKQANNKLPDIFNEYFKYRNETHSINTKKLNTVKAKTNYGRKQLDIKELNHTII